ncbi:hypothetical protein [Coleofasciculus sp. LEGE 07092]|uniref:hypothetical protein n=1 Tax=Coleofasciculus sp. LEGE 07092 TaxID=2777969 RepID=UPI001882B8E8|nr:hypothetical protein [Coleofasciculus sp. LEGE 07092]MBE9149060.1 hypothetical protein [Coleofasciculus sp. LEGE 07092]
MARKKSTRKKLNLSNLDSLTANVPPNSEQPELEDSKSEQPELEDSKSEQPELEDSKSEQPELEDSKSEQPELEDSKSEQPELESSKSELSKPEKTVEEKSSNRASEGSNGTGEKKVSVSTPPKPPERPPLEIRPKRPDKEPPRKVTEVTNEAGEVFKFGDQISVKAPWGGQATAQIASFYQDNEGNRWVQYNPLTSMPNWSWDGGCTRAKILQKAME